MGPTPRGRRLMLNGRWHPVVARPPSCAVCLPQSRPPPRASRRTAFRGPSSRRRGSRAVRRRRGTARLPSGRRSAATARSRRCSTTAETFFDRLGAHWQAGPKFAQIDIHPGGPLHLVWLHAHRPVFCDHYGHVSGPSKSSLRHHVSGKETARILSGTCSRSTKLESSWITNSVI
jgi:hypothetical protein